jgi:Polyketide cyclase / dehydrase and lipid transport
MPGAVKVCPDILFIDLFQDTNDWLSPSNLPRRSTKLGCNRRNRSFKNHSWERTLGTTVVVIIGVLVVAVAAILGLAAMKPDAFRVQRSATIRAPREKIFPLINDFHHWGSWSPWEKLDPAMKKTHSGPAEGLGSVYEWEGNKQVGKGRMEIKESTPPSKVLIQLDFFKPFEAHNTAEFTLDGQGDSTNVVWIMDGHSPYMFKVMSLFMSMDKMIGKDFEAGLANLKSLTEK